MELPTGAFHFELHIEQEGIELRGFHHAGTFGVLFSIPYLEPTLHQEDFYLTDFLDRLTLHTLH